MPDNTPTFGASSQITLDEAFLPNGTRAGAGPLSASGFFTIQASGGIASASIDGRSFISGGVFTPVTDTTPLGEQISLQSYDSATGRVTYTYTLSQAVRAPNRSDQPDAPALVVTSNDGAQATGVVSGISIHDDAPIAGSSTNYIVLARGSTVSGNLLTGFASNGFGTPTVFGADGGGRITSSFAGSTGSSRLIGTLTSISANGDYTFTVNGSWPVGAQELYTFGVADADGSGTTVPVRFVIGADDNGDLINLASNPDKIGGGGSDTLVATSQFSNVLTGNGGRDLFQVDQFADITDFTVGTDQLDLSKVFAQLSPPYTGSDPVADGVVSLVSNGQGGTTVRVASGLAPHAVANLRNVDPNSVTYAQLVNGPLPPPPPPGQVFAADGTQNQVLTGTSGSDTINAGNNSVQITTGAGSDIVVFDKKPFNAGHIKDFVVSEDHLNVTALLNSIGYTGSDPVSDGFIILNDDHRGNTNVWFDPDGRGPQPNVTLTTLDGVFRPGLGSGEILTRNGSTSSNPPPSGEPVLYNADHAAVANGGTLGSAAFAESALSRGTAPDSAALTRSGAFYVSAANGVRSVAIGNQVVIDSSGRVVPNSVLLYDNLTLNVVSYDQASGKVSFTTTLTAPQANNEPSSLTRSSPVYLTDNNGHQTAASLLWTTLDDGVLGRADTATTAADATAALTGNVLANDAGADGVNVTAINGAPFSGATTVTGQLGVLSINVNGEYSYQLKAGATAGTDTFNYGLSDPYGDSASSTLTITVTSPGGSGGSGGSGQVITANDSPGQTLTGGAGNDTLNAGHNSVVETGGGGADTFAFAYLPWNAGRITDFTVGTDRVDLSQLFAASGYSGADPIADGYVILQPDGAGGTNVFYDTDGRASGNTIQFKITDLEHVAPTGRTWGQLSGSFSNPPPAGGRVITADDSPGQALTGGAGNDTLNAGHNSVVETGGGGADAFAFQYLPWNAGHITDFTLGTDRLDFSQLFAASGYGGADAIADGYVSLQSDGAGGTNVFFDTDGRASGNTIQYKITDLDHVAPSGVTWAQLAGSSGGPPPPPPPSGGQVLNGNDTPGQVLAGGAGNDTLNAGHNSVVETGGGGADRFVFQDLPWNAGHITDFTQGADHIDIAALLAASHYAGGDPIADGYLSLASDGAGGTRVFYDTDGRASGNTIQFLVTTVEHVPPSQLTGSDFLFH